MEYHSLTDLFSLVDDAGDIEAEVIEDLLCGGREPKRRHANLTVRVLQRCREESERDRQTDIDTDIQPETFKYPTTAFDTVPYLLPSKL